MRAARGVYVSRVWFQVPSVGSREFSFSFFVTRLLSWSMDCNQVWLEP